jgi:hypothetical protein
MDCLEFTNELELENGEGYAHSIYNPIMRI